MSGAPSVPGGTPSRGFNHGQGVGGKPLKFKKANRGNFNHGKGKVKGKDNG